MKSDAPTFVQQWSTSVKFPISYENRKPVINPFCKIEFFSKIGNFLTSEKFNACSSRNYLKTNTRLSNFNKMPKRVFIFNVEYNSMYYRGTIVSRIGNTYCAGSVSR